MKRIIVTGHWEGEGLIWREETAEETLVREHEEEKKQRKGGFAELKRIKGEL